MRLMSVWLRRAKHVGIEPQAHWSRLFLGRFRGPGPNEKALIKSSFLGGWKVGYQAHCHSSTGPTRLHLVNTFHSSQAEIRHWLPEPTLGFLSSLY